MDRAESIVRRKGWREQLAEDPDYFEEGGFEIHADGRVLSPTEAAETGVTGTFVQRPGAGNSLGRIKIGIENDQAIYLHDTNQPQIFAEAARLASSGCVRVEQIGEIAAWVLGISPDEMQALVDSGDVRNHVPPSPVRVILGYWTAWPDADGTIRIYPDVYGRDLDGDVCLPGREAASADLDWTEYVAQ